MLALKIFLKSGVGRVFGKLFIVGAAFKVVKKIASDFFVVG